MNHIFRHLSCVLFLALSTLTLSACGEAVDSGDLNTSKDQSALSEANTTYDDLVSPKCLDENDPNVYAYTPISQCKPNSIRCVPGYSNFSDACGCGCVKDPKPVTKPSGKADSVRDASQEANTTYDDLIKPTCQDPNDPNVSYVYNAKECVLGNVTCAPGWSNFSDACGCGCIKDTKPIGPAVRACGTILGLTCPKGQYCDYKPGQCNVSDAAGICKDIPQFCPKHYAPVCGCDGKTYGNSCEIQGTGTSIDYEGECKSNCPSPKDPGVIYVSQDPALCVGPPTLKCPANYTWFSDKCGCGCIEIKPTKTLCGGRLGDTCGKGEYCEFGKIDTHVCDFADANGVCTKSPVFCSKLLKPVCGCNNQTYDNECIANKNGVDAVTSGKCK